jgi:hypothetical protein
VDIVEKALRSTERLMSKVDFPRIKVQIVRKVGFYFMFQPEIEATRTGKISTSDSNDHFAFSRFVDPQNL